MGLIQSNKKIFKNRNKVVNKTLSWYVVVLLIAASVSIVTYNVFAEGDGNNPPNMPSQEEPSNTSTDRPINVNISWNCSDPDGDPLTFDIYFANYTLPLKVEANTSNMSYTPPVNLEYNTTYHWYIVAWDNKSANTIGPYWWFRTEDEHGGGAPPPGPSGNSSISGYVKDQDTGDPISNATVEITDNSTYNNMTVSGGDGYYIFTNLAVGNYSLSSYKPEVFPKLWNYVNITVNGSNIENVNFTVALGDSPGPGGDGPIDFDQWQSSLTPTFIMNNTQENFIFTIRSHGDGKIDNLTIIFPECFNYVGNNGTTISDLNYTVYNTENSVVWQKTSDDGFHIDEYEYFWFNASSNASLGSGQFNVIIYIDGNESDKPLSFTVFTTTSFYHTGSIFDINGQPLEGANATISAQSFSMDGPVSIGSFSAETNETGVYNITDIPTTTENANNLNFSGSMGPGGMDENEIFYQLSAADYNPVYTDLATHVSPSLPYIPIMEFIRLIGEPEIYLKPAISFRVNVTGPIYSWDQENHTMEVTTGLKNYSLMVKDQRLGFQVKELNTLSEEKTFSVPHDRDYSFTIFAEMSFPISIKFDDILTKCQGNQSFNLTGVTTEVMSYNDTYLINVTIDVSYTSRWLNGTFNNITDLLDMHVVVYNMEYQGDDFMVFENWAMPYNLNNEFRDGVDDQYNLITKEYNISLPATNAASNLLLRAYARNSSGYYMGSARITTEGQNLSQETINFDMQKLIQGDYSVNRTVTSNNVSNNWSETTVVDTIALLFNLVKDGELLNNENPFVEIKRELNGEIYNQMIDGASGRFNLSLVECEGLHKLTIYSQQYAPISMSVSADIISGAISTDTISCENGQCNITMRSFGEFDPLGKNATIMMMMYKSNATCDVPNPPDFCDLCASHDDDVPFGEEGNKSGEMSKDEFSPFAAILKGDISMMIKSYASNGTIYVYYINVDLLASGPPDASFSTDSQDAQDGLAKAWQFGSQGPEIYDYVLIGIPVEDDVINKTIKVTIPLLYDNEYNIIWNASAGDDIDTIYNDSTLLNLYGDYLNPPYAAYLNGTGVICNASDPTLSNGLGYKDVDNLTIWIKIPHFSGVGPEVTGQEPEPPTNFAVTINSTTENYLTWTKAANADYTYIERNDTDQTSWSKGSGIEIYNGTGEEYSNTGLTAGVTYYYQAWSWNQTNGYWSITNVSSTYYPNAPTDLSATAISSSSISLSWTKGNLSDNTRIQRKTGSYPTSISDGTNVYNGTGTSTTSTGLSASTKYYYSAWAWNSTNNVWSITYDTAYATTSSAGGDSPPGGGTTTDDEETEDEEEEQPQTTTNTTTSLATMDEVNTGYNLSLSEEFYATDTDEDGIVDTFIDPNNKLTSVFSTEINNNTVFLISIDDDEIPEFFWDTTTDTITQISYSPGTLSSETIDNEEQTITVEVTVDKPESTWIYIEIIDNYPDYELTVKTSDGRTIESDKIYRKDGKIYVLDDPDTEYEFIYGYEILEPTFNPATETSFSESDITVTITYNEIVTIQSATLNNAAITLETTDNLVFTYSAEGLENGEYILSVTAKDNENNTRTDIALYTINIEPEDDGSGDGGGVPWYIWIILVVSTILIVIGILFKTGFLYIEKTKKKK